MKTIDRTGSAVVALPSDLEIQIIRKFDAPADLVFDVWTKPEHVRNWWGYPEHPMTVCEIDLRVGGGYRYAAVVPDFGEIAFHGVFTEIDRPRLLVATEVYEAFPDSQAINTLTLEEEEGVTTATMLVLHPNQQARDGHIQSGMEGGLQVSLNRIDAILENMREHDH